MSTLLYWCIMLNVVITCSHSLYGARFTRKQNSRNTAWIVLGFKNEGDIDKFIKETSFNLTDPPKVVLN